MRINLMALGLGLAVVFLLVGAPVHAALEARGASGLPAELAQSPAIVGTWVLTSPGPSVRLVQSYNADGTMLSIHDEHGSRNTQLGVWTQLGEREFLMRNVSYRFDVMGQPVAMIEVRGTYIVEPDGASMVGRGLRVDLDLSGAPLSAPVPWESRATRMVPLPVEALGTS
jgi:hypothetical protein